ncbi:DUF1844 domain-containing protein [candidate division KSB1 bacterium]
MMSGDTSAIDDKFISLILNFQMSAMIGMGKLMNPVTNKTERKLDDARIAIDMLEMMQQKTRGNLASEEERMLNQVLTDLRLNYIHESSRSDHEVKEPAQQEAAPAEKQEEPVKPAKDTRKKKKTKAKKGSNKSK